MVKSAKNRRHGDLSEPLNRAVAGRILGQGQMGPRPVVICGIRRKNSAQMVFAKDDDVIEAFPADRADQPLRMSILPR